jgi:hypothetical protein
VRRSQSVGLKADRHTAVAGTMIEARIVVGQGAGATG